jgi:hypothetical protein
LSSTPPVVEYQYQMHYPRIWGWPGPGLSIGGSLPATGREGISSFYGLPFPVPLGAGAYMNPFAYSARLPGPMNFGLASSPTASDTNTQGNGQPIGQTFGSNPALPPAPTGYFAQSAAPAPVPRQAVESDLITIQKSREIESFGDEQLRNQNWIQAYINYRNAVLTADDLAEPHARLGWACIALKRFSEATQEFKRALAIDPLLGNSGETIETIFGIENPAIRNELVQGVAKWAKEDLRDQDRLFLLGLVLRFNQDSRSGEVIEAAFRIPGPNDHLVALMTPAVRVIQTAQTVDLKPQAVVPPPAPQPLPPVPSPPELPELHQHPIALH